MYNNIAYSYSLRLIYIHLHATFHTQFLQHTTYTYIIYIPYTCSYTTSAITSHICFRYILHIYQIYTNMSLYIYAIAYIPVYILLIYLTCFICLIHQHHTCLTYIPNAYLICIFYTNFTYIYLHNLCILMQYTSLPYTLHVHILCISYIHT